jgi:hypothetical protein
MNHPTAGESSRLSYERLRGLHAHELCHALTDPRVYEWILRPHASSINELIDEFAVLESSRPVAGSDELWWNFVVRLRDSRRAIGRIQATAFGDWAEVM